MENQIKFIENYVFPKIIAESKELNDLKFINASISRSSAIDGFMGNIIFASLEFETKDRKCERLNVVVKLMKPPSLLRTNMGADYQFINEVSVYKNVIPTFLSKFQNKFRKIEKSLWCPQVYLTEIGKYSELSETTETILVMENLSEKDFRLGARNNLTKEELILMTRSIAEFHACTYALRVNNDPDLEKLINGLLPFSFEKEPGRASFNRMYLTGMERLFNYLDSNPEEIDNDTFRKNLNFLRTEYGSAPIKLMERFLRSDNMFSVISHGDYNRNNVLFKYEENTAVDLRFIDFQEVKYGSPAIDLSFFIYMNMQPSLFESGLNEKLIYLYHERLIKSLCELLECDQQDERLSTYCWDNFSEHYKQFALYGAMVSVMFSKWNLFLLFN